MMHVVHVVSKVLVFLLSGLLLKRFAPIITAMSNNTIRMDKVKSRIDLTKDL